ncbi:dimethylamine monooxygenase subunit DmmA family protein [Metabacillus sp. YM-086]
MKEYRIFDSIYSAEVKVEDGTFPNDVGISMATTKVNSIVSYQVISKKDRLVRLFYQSSNKSPFIELTFNSDNQLSMPNPLKKFLLFLDESSLIVSLALIRYLSTKSINCYVYFLTDMNNEDHKSLYFQDILGERFSRISPSHEEIKQILHSQEIGTRLFLLGKWSTVDDIEKIANDIGFTNEEIDKHGVGEKTDHIFCAKCYQFNLKQDPLQEEATCSHCQTKLDVSNHFSKRLNAYLGYIHV